MDYQGILYEKIDNIAVLTLNQPKQMNALSDQMLNDLHQVADEIEQDRSVRALILTGAGRSFCAGGDIERIKKGFEAADGIEYMDNFHKWVKKWVQLNIPIIAAINGAAVGAGLSLMLLCDYSIAAENAVFGSAFINMSLVPDLAAAYFLPKVVGVNRAKELFFSGRNVGSKEALQMGLVNRITALDLLMEEAVDMAKTAATKPAFALQATKRLVNQSLSGDINSLLAAEAYMQSACFLTQDSAEATKAFFEKRPPRFIGR